MIACLKRKAMIIILAVCFIFSIFGTIVFTVHAEGNVFEVKDMPMVTGVHEEKPMYDITVNMITPFGVAGATNLEASEELIQNNIVINDYTVGEINAFNGNVAGRIVIQIHRFEMVKIYIYDAFGNLPCGQHETASECDCETKRPVLLNDGTDEIVFKAGLTTGDLAASMADSVWGLRYGTWWKDGKVQEGAWKPAEEEGGNILPVYDLTRSPALSFYAQRLVSGSAIY